MNSSLAGSIDYIEEMEASKTLASAKIDLLRTIFVPTLTEELDTLSENDARDLLFDWTDHVLGIGDPELTAKFNAFLNSGLSTNQFVEFFIYLIESTIVTLE